MIESRATLPSQLLSEISKRYEIVREIGAGGMGVVFEARERVLDRRVAIKIIRTGGDDASRADLSSRFLREAQIAARLQHPGIVRLLYFDEIEGNRFFVMPYVEGESLALRLKRGPLAEEDAVRIVADVADALGHAHEHGIVHRDVKPSNILLAENRAIVADFGIAKSVSADRLTLTGNTVGTPTYMSPEQWRGSKDIDERSDVYSLGVLAYELVAGAPPFDGGTFELMRKHCDEIPTGLSERAPDVSAGYAAAVMRSLSKNREERWRSVHEFARALHAGGDDDIDRAELRPIRGVLAKGVLASGLIATWGTIPFLVEMPDNWPDMAVFSIWLLFTAAPLLVAVIAVARHIRTFQERAWGEVLSVGMRAPEWWHAWWPRSWLSGFDRSPLLPWVAKRAVFSYVAATSAIAVTLAFIGIAVSLSVAWSEEHWRYEVYPRPPWIAFGFFVYIVLPIILGVLLLVFICNWWRARQSIGWLTDPRSRRFFERLRTPDTWREPWVAQLIQTAGRSDVKPPQEFSELVSEVVTLQKRIAKTNTQSDSDLVQVIVAARDKFEEWQREVQSLQSDLEGAELERLEARLRLLESTISPRPDQIAERELLRRQLSLYLDRLEQLQQIQATSERLQAAVAEVWRELRAIVTGGADLDKRIVALRTTIARIRQLLNSQTETVRVHKVDGAESS